MPVSATYITLQRAIADELGDRSDLLVELSGSSLTTSPIKRAIQSAIAKWEREQFYFNEEYTSPLLTTVAGTEFYTDTEIGTSADIYVLHALINSNRYALRKVNWQDIEDKAFDTTGTGQPFEWAYFGGQIRFFPIPDDAYPIRATRTAKVTSLSSDSDTNVWTTEAFDLIRSEAKLVLARDVLHDAELKAECEEAIYGNPGRPRDKGYYGALKAETMRRARSGVRATAF